MTEKTPLFDPTSLIDAAQNNQLDDVKDLLNQGVDPTWDDSLALWWAVRHKNEEMIDVLLPVSDVSAYDNEILRIAFTSSTDETEMLVRKLLPYCNPLSDKSTHSPLWLACNLQHTEALDVYVQKYPLEELQEKVKKTNMFSSADEFFWKSYCEKIKISTALRDVGEIKNTLSVSKRKL